MPPRSGAAPGSAGHGPHESHSTTGYLVVRLSDRASLRRTHARPERSAMYVAIARNSSRVLPSLSWLTVMKRPLLSLTEYQGPFCVMDSLRSPSGTISSDTISWYE